jgi:hypothetical protein
MPTVDSQDVTLVDGSDMASDVQVLKSAVRKGSLETPAEPDSEADDRRGSMKGKERQAAMLQAAVAAEAALAVGTEDPRDAQIVKLTAELATAREQLTAQREIAAAEAKVEAGMARLAAEEAEAERGKLTAELATAREQLKAQLEVAAAEAKAETGMALLAVQEAQAERQSMTVDLETLREQKETPAPLAAEAVSMLEELLVQRNTLIAKLKEQLKEAGLREAAAASSPPPRRLSWTGEARDGDA